MGTNRFIFSAVVAGSLLSGCSGPDPIRCPTKYVFVLDRTTKFDKRSRELYVDGVRRMTSDDFLHGRLVGYEIHGTGIGYQQILEVTDVPQKPVEFTERKCPIDVFGPTYADCVRENDKGKARHKELSDGRMKILGKMLGDLVSLGTHDAPDDSDTIISEAVENIVRKECRGQNCVIYMMSDLIERNVRSMVHRRDGAPKPDPVSLADRQSKAILGDELPDEKSHLAVMVWGVGRDEVAGREIGLDARHDLERYWHEVFLKLGFSQGAMMSYEFPDLDKSGFPLSRERTACHPK